MNNQRITAIYTTCVQTGPDTWQPARHTKTFNSDQTFNDVLKWASGFGVKTPTINDVQLAQHED